LGGQGPCGRRCACIEQHMNQQGLESLRRAPILPLPPTYSTLQVAASTYQSLPYAVGSGPEPPQFAAALKHLESVPAPDQELLLLFACLLRTVAAASGGPGSEAHVVTLGRWVVRLLLGAQLASHPVAQEAVLSYIWYYVRNDVAYGSLILAKNERIERRRHRGMSCESDGLCVANPALLVCHHVILCTSACSQKCLVRPACYERPDWQVITFPGQSCSLRCSFGNPLTALLLVLCQPSSSHTDPGAPPTSDEDLLSRTQAKARAAAALAATAGSLPTMPAREGTTTLPASTVGTSQQPHTATTPPPLSYPMRAEALQSVITPDYQGTPYAMGEVMAAPSRALAAPSEPSPSQLPPPQAPPPPGFIATKSVMMDGR
jgi:hypothetical protein